MRALSMLCVHIVVLLISMTYDIQCEEYKPKFCDQNYVDSVPFDKLDYKLVRDKWFAEYDKESGRVGEFKLWKHIHESKFCIELNIYDNK